MMQRRFIRQIQRLTEIRPALWRKLGDFRRRCCRLVSGNAIHAQLRRPRERHDADGARTAQRATQAELSAAQLQAQQAAAAVSGVDALVAQRAVIMAEIALAELNLEYATVRAPFDGRVVSLKTSTGQFATALKPVFTLIDTRHWYVVAVVGTLHVPAVAVSGNLTIAVPEIAGLAVLVSARP